MSRRCVRACSFAYAIVVGAAAVGCATASDDVGTTIDGGGVHDTGASGDVVADTGAGDARSDSGAPVDTGSIDTSIDDTGVEIDSGVGVDSSIDTGTSFDTSVSDTGVIDTGVDTRPIDTGVDTRPIDTGTDTFVPPIDTGFDVGSDATTGCTVVEGFETGGFGASWVDVSGAFSGTFTSASAHDGSYGWGETSTSDWSYRTTPSVGASGDRLTAWVRGNTGRVYLGFSASASGAKSFVFAPNTGDIRFQDNAGWGFTELNSTATSIVASHWYMMEIVFSGGTSVTGHLYDSDGTTLLATVTQSYASLSVGGIAIRSFGSGASSDVDTIRFCSGP